jgi:Protein of unknown function with PCYCGC motif
MPIPPRPTRRLPRFVLWAAALLVLAPSAACAQAHSHGASHTHTQTGTVAAAAQVRHPAPRQDLPADYVVRADNVPERARDEFTIAARIPQVLDGLYCHCECHERDGLRSLLDCFHGEGMATSCGICQRQATRAAELHDQGRTLSEIRKTIDREFGG